MKNDFQQDLSDIRQSIQHQHQQPHRIPPTSQAPLELNAFLLLERIWTIQPSPRFINSTQCSTLDAEYSSILLLNAQSVNPSAKSPCKWKLPYISENFLYKKHDNVPIVDITEFWLKNYITDAQIHIFKNFYFEGFTSIPTALTANDRNRRMQVYQAGILCLLQTISTILININRPPNSSSKSLLNLLKHI